MVTIQDSSHTRRKCALVIAVIVALIFCFVLVVGLSSGILHTIGIISDVARGKFVKEAVLKIEGFAVQTAIEFYSSTQEEHCGWNSDAK